MKKAAVFAILAALFYAISVPISKLLMVEIPSAFLAGFLYLGAGVGMGLTYGAVKVSKAKIEEESLTKKDTLYVVLMIVLDIAAPILLMTAISMSNAASVSLINNFEIVATALIALVFFKEKISPKLWLGIALVLSASVILSIDFENGVDFNMGSLFALLACLCWGLENNSTRKISDKNTFQITILKGVFSGVGSIIVALILQEKIGDYLYILYALLLGFVSYGLSVFLYVKAQKYLGAAKTSAFYAVAPFIGVTLSFIISRKPPHFTFYIALAVMAVAMIFVVLDKFDGVRREGVVDEKDENFQENG